MKYLITGLTLALLSSCAINKNVEEDIIIRSTETIPHFHTHICIDGEEECFYFEEDTYETIDTIYYETSTR
ncbi:MAG: hypothetical protein SLAVMIC_00115 [uncultured marine phage]|uniref:Lipoprotein n=1 Tax=uncultured marine phage TaxID=707152 RepID=A0A8D9CDJ5_9VIRU|nr:MAG: hypothetical protein SLAVMIC_00115 [uncultured marine phage]